LYISNTTIYFTILIDRDLVVERKVEGATDLWECEGGGSVGTGLSVGMHITFKFPAF
jgi:hypothetical protein